MQTHIPLRHEQMGMLFMRVSANRAGPVSYRLSAEQPVAIDRPEQENVVASLVGDRAS